ncbi:Fur-regulated basic protein FbpA [Metabacillus malikii]|uniref:Fur-regulated basic protein FbpA n=1 Tax=Metabacillus malikii TaxID=1504265 RepID=A0ABT9ZCB5_9BACI|nr:Fur-regulated basic protein FbpA [Metabacillus malikii]MDQ0229446.1 hypothetical protein [Metabacillus malikii]
MSKMLQNALEEQRNYYSQKLLAIGVYNQQVLNQMTLTELKEEYQYFYHTKTQKKVREPKVKKQN